MIVKRMRNLPTFCHLFFLSTFLFSLSGTSYGKSAPMTSQEIASKWPRHNPARVQKLLQTKKPLHLLRMLAEDTWVYFDKMVDPDTNFVFDNILISSQKTLLADYTSITNIGLHMACIIGAEKIHLVSHKKALRLLNKTLEALGRLKRWNGLWFNYYKVTKDEHDKTQTSTYVSSVDNSWLAAGLILVRNTYPSLEKICTTYLEKMDFSSLYDKSMNLFHPGIDTRKDHAQNNHYGLLNSEARMISYIACAKGDVPLKHMFSLNRTLPKEWSWPAQRPKGFLASNHATQKTYFQGHYLYQPLAEQTSKEYRGYKKFNKFSMIRSLKKDIAKVKDLEKTSPTLLTKKQSIVNEVKTISPDQKVSPIKFVPSWGGSLFEALMPLLFVNESKHFSKSWRINHQRMVNIHIDYSLADKKYPLWGMSPCSIPESQNSYRYTEYGVPTARSAERPYNEDGVVTPHVTFLSMLVYPEKAVKNIRNYLYLYPEKVYGPCGLYDAVNVKTDQVAPVYLALDQAMTFLALVDVLTQGKIRKIFESDPWFGSHGKFEKMVDLCNESFFKKPIEITKKNKKKKSILKKI
ncbi:hypothetical protein AB834_06125 [PVC group bacterium (ex Bugula neritina AB1)]|nr:hypothetical protein AB834_06125 [PVC group bacterium (ex Bugula neritina AB1)]